MQVEQRHGLGWCRLLNFRAAQVLTPQQFRKVEDDNDIFNHSNRHFWEVSPPCMCKLASSMVTHETEPAHEQSCIMHLHASSQGFTSGAVCR